MKRRIDIPEDLVKLAGCFKDHAPLFVTGGYVRNSILGLKCDDIDIASSLHPKKVIEILPEDFKAVPVNIKLGTLKIISSDGSYEYTAFRRDSYPKSSGVHKPSTVTFTEDIGEDARRRDFTANAVYYDIVKDEIIDILGGICDIKNKILKTVVSPDRVFSEDGLRILRLIRFSSELGFSVDKDTLNSAISRKKMLLDIAAERIFTEFNKILYADLKYGINNAHYQGIKLLIDTGIGKIIFPDIEINYDILKDCNPEIRLSAMLINNEKELSEKDLNNIKFKNSEIKTISRLQELFKKTVNEDNALDIFLENGDIIENFIALLKLYGREDEEAIIKEIIDKIRENKLPDHIGKLKVKGEDLISLNIPEKERARVLKALLKAAVVNNLNTKEKQINYLRGINKWTV